jgi:hypothetical protein
MTLLGATRAALVLAAVAAVLVARRRADHRPIAAFLVATVVANTTRAALAAYVFGPARADMRAAGLDPTQVPFTGGARLAAWVEMGAFLIWPAGIAAMVIAVYLRRRPWLIAVAWALAAFAMGYAYPLTRGDVLRRCYLAAELAGLAVAVGTIATWFPRRAVPTLPIGVALCIVVVELGSLIGPYLGNPFATWERAQALYLVLYLAIVVLQGGSLWKPSSSTHS